MESLKPEAVGALLQVCLPSVYNKISVCRYSLSTIELLILSQLQRKFLMTGDSLLSLHTLSSMLIACL